MDGLLFCAKKLRQKSANQVSHVVRKTYRIETMSAFNRCTLSTVKDVADEQ